MPKNDREILAKAREHWMNQTLSLGMQAAWRLVDKFEKIVGDKFTIDEVCSRLDELSGRALELKEDLQRFKQEHSWLG